MNLPRLLALLALVLTVGPAVLFAAGVLGDGPMKLLLLAGAVLWFAAAPRWLKGGTD
jgi:Flp pilus assembly protein protease CpaA